MGCQQCKLDSKEINGENLELSLQVIQHKPMRNKPFMTKTQMMATTTSNLHIQRESTIVFLNHTNCNGISGNDKTMDCDWLNKNEGVEDKIDNSIFMNKLQQSGKGYTKEGSSGNKRRTIEEVGLIGKGLENHDFTQELDQKGGETLIVKKVNNNNQLGCKRSLSFGNSDQQKQVSQFTEQINQFKYYRGQEKFKNQQDLNFGVTTQNNVLHSQKMAEKQLSQQASSSSSDYSNSLESLKEEEEEENDTFQMQMKVLLADKQLQQPEINSQEEELKSHNASELVQAQVTSQNGNSRALQRKTKLKAGIIRITSEEILEYRKMYEEFQGDGREMVQ